MSLENQYSVTVRVGAINLGVFDRFSGGEVDSEETKYSPGAMGPQVSLGGKTTVGNVTVSRLYELARDHAVSKDLIAAVGKSEVTVTKQPLDADRNPYGAPHVYTGKLKSVSFPDHNSESSDPGMLELEVSSAGAIG